MHNKTSHFSAVFFWNNIHKLKWLFALNALILLIGYPLNLFFAQHSIESLENLSVVVGSLLSLNRMSIANVSIAIFPVLFAIVSFNYLQNIGDSVRTHSMPITRKQLFTANMASGLLTTWLPYLIAAIALIGLQPAMPQGTLTFTQIGQWLMICLLFSSVFFTSTVLSGMITGNSIFQAIFVYIMLLLPAGIQSLLSENLAYVMKGFSGHITTGFTYCSPLATFMLILKRDALTYLPSWFWLLQVAYIVIFTLGAYQLYKIRKLEHVGQTIQFSILNPLLKSLGVFCFMLLSGLLLRDITNQNIALIFGYLFGGILGYVLLEMIIQKNIQCKLYFKEIGLMMLSFFVGFALIALDLTHYGKKAMPSETIQAVYFSPSHTYLTTESDRLRFEDPETIQAIEKLYQKSILTVPSLFWLEPHQYTDPLHFIFVNKSGHAFERVLYVKPSTLDTELSEVLKTKAYFQAQYPALELSASEVETVRLNTPFGQVVFSDPEWIQQLVQTAQKETYLQSPVANKSSKLPLATLAFTISNKASSYPFREDAKDDEEMRVECDIDLNTNYAATYALLLSNKKASDILITEDKISKILIKPVSKSTGIDDADSSQARLSENDPEVHMIDDTERIHELMAQTLYHEAQSSNAYWVNYVFKSDTLEYLSGYLLDANIPLTN